MEVSRHGTGSGFHFEGWKVWEITSVVPAVSELNLR